MVHGFLLAFIGQAIAMPAREQFAGGVQLGDATAAIPAIGLDRASKPRAKSAEVAGRPRDWHALIDGHPLAVSRAPRPEHQDNSVSFGPHADAAGAESARTSNGLCSHDDGRDAAGLWSCEGVPPVIIEVAETHPPKAGKKLGTVNSCRGVIRDMA